VLYSDRQVFLRGFWLYRISCSLVNGDILYLLYSTRKQIYSNECSYVV